MGPTLILSLHEFDLIIDGLNLGRNFQGLVIGGLSFEDPNFGT